MSRESQDDQDKSPTVAAEIVPSASSPVVMITSANEGVYVTDQRLTKWVKVADLSGNKVN